MEGVVILAAPRSGTTLLRRLLDAHPALACPGETTLLRSAARFLQADPLAGGGRFGVLHSLSHAGFSQDEVLDRLRGLCFSFLDDIAKDAGASMWVEKTAVNIYHLPAITKLCGDRVHYIGVVRHGLDVAISMKDLSDKGGVYLSELHRYVQQHAQPMVAFAHAWVQACAHLQKLQETCPDQVTILRYEDLVADVEGTLRPVLVALGLDWDPVVLTGWNQQSAVGFGDWRAGERATIDGSSVGRWQSLDPFTISTLADVCNQMLQRWGYDPIPTAPIDDAEAMRRYEMVLRLHALKQNKD